MKDFITKNKLIKLLLTGLFWLLLWQGIAMLVNQEFLFVSPIAVCRRLWGLGRTADFWLSSLLSLWRILAGFVAGVIIGIVLAVLTAKISFLQVLFEPFLKLVKATPVASFIMLAFVWMKNENIPIFAAFLMVLPVVWGNIYEGLQKMDPLQKEVAHVFHFSRLKRLRHLYLPTLMPFFSSACITSIGLSWKAGVAAEVITVPSFSVGAKIHESKVYLETLDLFVWTTVVILLSVLLEKIFVLLMNALSKRKGA